MYSLFKINRRKYKDLKIKFKEKSQKFKRICSILKKKISILNFHPQFINKIVKKLKIK